MVASYIPPYALEQLSVRNTARKAAQEIIIDRSQEPRIVLSWTGYTRDHKVDSFKHANQTTIKPTSDLQLSFTKSARHRINVPSWGLARISSKKKLTDPTKGYHDPSAGAGTTAYILDTGIYAEHDDFQGRAKLGFNAVRNPTSRNTDLKGHGTHVAGIIGGKLYGVAKKANLIAIKVLGDDGVGLTSDVIKGLEWAVQDAKRRGVEKCVVNMSFAGEYSHALNRAVRSAVRSGLAVIVAAGNAGENVRDFSPSSETSAITVGASDQDDKVWQLSNYGPLVDIFAPGVLITSAWIDKDTCTTDESKVRSGTSMATPHVTGLALCLLSHAYSTYTPRELKDKIINLALRDQLHQLTLRDGSPNLLVYNDEGRA